MPSIMAPQGLYVLQAPKAGNCSQTNGGRPMSPKDELEMQGATRAKLH
jgi:hypothetical protein